MIRWIIFPTQDRFLAAVRHQNFLHIRGDSVPVHCAFDHPPADQPALRRPCPDRVDQKTRDEAGKAVAVAVRSRIADHRADQWLDEG